MFATTFIPDYVPHEELDIYSPYVVLHNDARMLTSHMLKAHLEQWREMYDEEFPEGFLSYLREIGYKVPMIAGSGIHVLPAPDEGE
jgi:hypothetical protein